MCNNATMGSTKDSVWVHQTYIVFGLNRHAAQQWQTQITQCLLLCLLATKNEVIELLTLGHPGGWVPPHMVFFPCNFFDDSNRENRLIVSVTRDGRHILAYVTSSWRCHVTYVMTTYVHDGGQNTLYLPSFVNRDIFWCRSSSSSSSI